MIEKKPKVVAILIAYNASSTLEKFYKEFPKHYVDEIILVDDVSRDNTFELAKKLGIESYQNPVNLGYGGNLKRAKRIALEKGADIVIDIHPDGEYSPHSIPAAIKEIEDGADMVLGNRFSKGKTPKDNGMFWWKPLPIRALNAMDNLVLGTRLGDLHQGFRVYSKELLNKINFEGNSDNYLFSFEIIAQAVHAGAKISQVPVDTSYTGEKRGASFAHCVRYGLSTFPTLFMFVLAKMGFKTKIFK